MPELPEVETIKNDLKKRILDIRISDISVVLERSIKNEIRVFKKTLAGNKFKDIRRVGKLLIFELARGNKYLLVHLKMTGQLIYQYPSPGHSPSQERGGGRDLVAGGHSEPGAIGELPGRHTRAWFGFADGGRLFFNDLRTFGYLKLVDAAELEKVTGRFGVEPIDRKFDFILLKKLIKNRKTNIKALLLNQQIIAGLGNIYADETLFRAGVLPGRRADTLTDAEIKKIAQAAKAVLRAGIKYRGTTFNNYRDADGNKGGFIKLLKVYGRAGEKCKKCGQTIIKTKIAGRGTHYCSGCQS